MKALEILKTIKRVKWWHIGEEISNNIDEAIAELEALQQPKTCDGCKYEDGEIYKTLIEHGYDIHICSLCSRGTNDYFKPKDNA